MLPASTRPGQAVLGLSPYQASLCSSCCADGVSSCAIQGWIGFGQPTFTESQPEPCMLQAEIQRSSRVSPSKRQYSRFPRGHSCNGNQLREARGESGLGRPRGLPARNAIGAVVARRQRAAADVLVLTAPLCLGARPGLRLPNFRKEPPRPTMAMAPMHCAAALRHRHQGDSRSLQATR